jgi:nucleotide-binding universal stress UspA family protein
MYSKIICAIGLGPREKAEHMLRRASELIDSDGQIVLVHVLESVPHYVAQSLPSSFELSWMQDAEEKLKSLCTRLDAQALLVVRAGRTAPTILTIAREQGADLIIVGSHIKDVTDMFFGSVVDHIAHRATCAVLIDRN